MKKSTSLQDVLPMEASMSALFAIGGNGKMSEEITTKWYLGKNSERVYAVYKARFDGSILLNEQMWSLPRGEAWSKTNQVSEWFFIGNDNVWESTEEEARTYLPEEAFSNS